MQEVGTSSLIKERVLVCHYYELYIGIVESVRRRVVRIVIYIQKLKPKSKTF